MTFTFRICLVLPVFLLMAVHAQAAPAYGTKLPEKNQFFGGLQTYSVLERELEGPHGEMESLQHFVLLSYGVFDWLSLDLKGGAGNIDQTPDGADTIHYPSFMAGGYGFRVRLYGERDSTAKIVFGFQHISVHPYSQDIESNPNGSKFKAVLDDWQFSLLGSYDLGFADPYFGGRWSRMDYIHWIDDQRNRIKSDTDKSFGVILGADVPVNDRLWLNIEGSFADAQAIAGSLNYAF